jgi:hypothetical protein
MEKKVIKNYTLFLFFNQITITFELFIIVLCKLLHLYLFETFYSTENFSYYYYYYYYYKKERTNRMKAEVNSHQSAEALSGTSDEETSKKPRKLLAYVNGRMCVDGHLIGLLFVITYNH